MIAEKGECDWGEDKGQLAVGDHWWQRLYSCADRWIYVAARDDQARTLVEVVTGQSDSDETLLETMFVKQDCTYWQQKLDAAQIACHEVMNITDLCDRADIRRVDQVGADEIATGPGEILCYEDHPCGVPIIINAQDWVRVGEERSWKRLSAAVRPGYHSKEILKELGYTDTEIEELFHHKIVHEHPQGLVSNDGYFYGPEN